MKTVFANDECVHVYAQRTHDQGRTNNGNIFFNGDTLYSYGYHFPLAHFINDNTVIINDDSYSMTTSNHQALVRQALRHYRAIYLDTSMIESVINHGVYDKKSLEAKSKQKAEEYLLSATKRRATHTMESDVSIAVSIVKNCLKTTEAFNRKPSVSFRKFADEILNDNTSILKELSVKAEKLLQDKKNKAEQYLKKWLNFKIDLIPYTYREFIDIHMRVSEDNIETSEGVRFPLNEAIAAFKMIRRVKESGQSLNFNDVNLGVIKLGYYKIDKITCAGHVKAGCHFVKWPQIETIARQLNIYP